MSRARQPHATLRVTVDLVILTIREGRLHVLLVERGNEPFRGRSALPGGFLRADEDLVDAARRELDEETGVGGRLHLEQLSTYGTPDRDPRGRVVTVAFLAIAPDLPMPVAGSDAREAGWLGIEDVPKGLAFDHDRILADGVERARRVLEDTTLATAFCPDPFTMAELRQVYEAVWGLPLDPRNFSRKVLGTAGFVEATGERRSATTGRPAALYRHGGARVLYPAMLRSNIDHGRHHGG